VQRSPRTVPNLGSFYFNGEDVAKDSPEAVKWFRKAAEQGLPLGECALGTCYADGDGVAQDIAEAVKWWRKATEKGDAEAQNNLGFSYYKGEGMAKDYVEAYKWFSLASGSSRRSSTFLKNLLAVRRVMTP
jgi:TPR repeat protein